MQGDRMGVTHDALRVTPAHFLYRRKGGTAFFLLTMLVYEQFDTPRKRRSTGPGLTYTYRCPRKEKQEKRH
jgi:hypothetical protein